MNKHFSVHLKGQPCKKRKNTK